MTADSQTDIITQKQSHRDSLRFRAGIEPVPPVKSHVTGQVLGSVDPSRRIIDILAVKIVGQRNSSENLMPLRPQEAVRRAAVLQAQAELLNPYPRPRGFVFKAKTREEYARWRQAQSNPRLW